MAYKDFVTQWTSKVQKAVKSRDEWASQFNVVLARAYFEGNQKPDWARPNEWITLNMIYSHLQAQLPSLYSIDPYFYVGLSKTYVIDPQQTAEWDLRGKTRQAYLNYLKKELDLKSKARLCIQDAHFAYGVMKTHYIANLKDNELAGQPIVDELGKPMVGENGEELLHPDVIPVNGRYAITRVHPDDLIFGCDSGSLSGDWEWVAERLKMTLYEAKKDKRFDKSAIKSIELKQQNNKKDINEDVDDRVIELWEVYNIKREEFFIFSVDADKPIVKKQPVPVGIEKHPYSILRFTLRDNSPYPIPPISQGIDPQREYNDLRSKLLTHRKRFNRKYECNVNTLEDPDVELSKLEIGEDGTIIRKMTGDVCIHPISDAPLDQQNYTEISMLKNDMVELLGAPDSSRGIASSTSATQADILDKRLEIKEGDRISIVLDWLIDIARKVDQLVQTHIQGDEAVKIIGPEGEFWKEIKQTDYEKINGEYEYTVNVGATQPKLPQLERAQWIAFLSQVVIPMPAILTKPNLMKKMAAMFGIEDESMITEMVDLGKTIMGAQGAQPQAQGSQAGVPHENPVGATMGLMNGLMGGNANGGGAAGGMMNAGAN